MSDDVVFDLPSDTRLPTLAEVRRLGGPPRKRTAVKTGGGPKVWICWARMKLHYGTNQQCVAGRQRGHADCGWHVIEKSD